MSGRVCVHLPSTLSVLIMALIGSGMGIEWQRIDGEKQSFVISPASLPPGGFVIEQRCLSAARLGKDLATFTEV